MGHQVGKLADALSELQVGSFECAVYSIERHTSQDSTHDGVRLGMHNVREQNWGGRRLQDQAEFLMAQQAWNLVRE